MFVGVCLRIPRNINLGVKLPFTASIETMCKKVDYLSYLKGPKFIVFLPLTNTLLL